ncbi:type II toxin-antitoxin system VapC family toxin [Candidatus Micrarchaeota archaeon]|nr:type II toxin-antitoxin system VapC family toxin [Candidatus Micrarchaeota archaeon]
MVLVDSNVWIGYFNSNDRHHEKALQIISSFRTNGDREIYITSGIIHEVINHLFKIKGSQFARKTLETVLSLPNLRILFLSDSLWQRTIENFNLYEMGLTDAQIVSVMEEKKETILYSFDGHFDQVKWIKRVF